MNFLTTPCGISFQGKNSQGTEFDSVCAAGNVLYYNEIVLKHSQQVAQVLSPTSPAARSPSLVVENNLPANTGCWIDTVFISVQDWYIGSLVL